MKIRLLLIVFLVSLCFSNSASAAKHCYALKNVEVLNKHCRKVGVIKSGTTFVYRKEKSGFIQFNYYGRYRYARVTNLVTNGKLKKYVQTHSDRFGQRIETKNKAKVYYKRTIKGAPKSFSKGTRFNVYSSSGIWYKVYLDGVYGYLKQQDVKKYCFVDVKDFYRPLISTTNTTSKRQKILAYAKKFLGNPYVWGGTSLTNGIDCSGYTQAIMRAFGISLPRCSYQQATVGKKVAWDRMKPGDLIFYVHGSRVGHVAMYAGKGMMVHAKGAAWGIVCTKVNKNNVACVRNVID